MFSLNFNRNCFERTSQTLPSLLVLYNPILLPANLLCFQVERLQLSLLSWETLVLATHGKKLGSLSNLLQSRLSRLGRLQLGHSPCPLSLLSLSESLLLFLLVQALTKQYLSLRFLLESQQVFLQRILFFKFPYFSLSFSKFFLLLLQPLVHLIQLHHK